MTVAAAGKEKWDWFKWFKLTECWFVDCEESIKLYGGWLKKLENFDEFRLLFEWDEDEGFVKQDLLKVEGWEEEQKTKFGLIFERLENVWLDWDCERKGWNKDEIFCDVCFEQ